MPVIVISGRPGAGSSTVAYLIAKKLHLRYFSPGKLVKSLCNGTAEKLPYFNVFKATASRHGFDLDKEPISSKSYEAGAAFDFWHSKLGGSKSFNNIIDEVQSVVALNGNVVVDGKLSIHFLKNVSDLSIWLDCSVAVRAERVIKRDKVSLSSALRLVEEREALERRTWKKLYGFDYFKQEQEADLVVNVSSLTPDGIVKKIFTNVTF